MSGITEQETTAAAVSSKRKRFALLAFIAFAAILLAPEWPLVPYPWRIDGSTQGWKKAIYLDPLEVLRLN